MSIQGSPIPAAIAATAVQQTASYSYPAQQTASYSYPTYTASAPYYGGYPAFSYAPQTVEKQEEVATYPAQGYSYPYAPTQFQYSTPSYTYPTTETTQAVGALPYSSHPYAAGYQFNVPAPYQGVPPHIATKGAKKKCC